MVEGSLLLVGDVRYVNDRPVLCEQADKLTGFNGLSRSPPFNYPIPTPNHPLFQSVATCQTGSSSVSWRSGVTVL